MDHPLGHPPHPGVAHRLRLCPVAQAQDLMVLSTALLEIPVQAPQAHVEWPQVGPPQCQVLVL